MTGLIIRGIGGFYYVDVGNDTVIEAKGRGILKKDGDALCVGDYVEVAVDEMDSSKGTIERLIPRENQFIRPPISNVDMLVIVFSAKSPAPNHVIIDKLLIMCESNDVEALICINKADLVAPDELKELKNIYADAVDCISLSAISREGIASLVEKIHGRAVAFAGPSGVGKSTIINCLIPNANMETGEISKKTKRGKHTTRHVEIFKTSCGGRIFDTPGFTSFDILEVEEERLHEFYPEFSEYLGKCQYQNCRHINEPNCAIKRAVENKAIHGIRYSSYVTNYKEIVEKRKY